MAGRPDLLRKCDRGRTAAAADVDHAFACLRLGAIDQDVEDRSQQDVLRCLPVGPALAARPVPVGDLVGILLVAMGGIHQQVSLVTNLQAKYLIAAPASRRCRSWISSA